jgi:hypothetical protein
MMDNILEGYINKTEEITEIINSDVDKTTPEIFSKGS